MAQVAQSPSQDHLDCWLSASLDCSWAAVGDLGGSLFNRDRLSRLVHGDINDFSLVDAHGFVRRIGPPSIYRNQNGNRGVSDLNYLRVKTNEVTDKNWRDEFHLMHRYGHQVFLRFLPRLNRAGLIDITQDQPAKNRAQRIRI